MPEYDSAADTLRHMRRVAALLNKFARSLIVRGEEHDESKLSPYEKPFFDVETPKLKELAYGSPEYAESLKRLRPALDNHYRVNSHHPEHYANGVNGMTLHDLVEMMCDWRAASERTKDGDFANSVEIGIKRFNIEPQLAAILRNSINDI